MSPPSSPPATTQSFLPQTPPQAASRRSYTPPDGGGSASLVSPLSSPPAPPPLINLSPSPPRPHESVRLLPRTSLDDETSPSSSSKEARRNSRASRSGGDRTSDEDGAGPASRATVGGTRQATLSSFFKEDFPAGPSTSNRNSAILFERIEAPFMAESLLSRGNRMSGLSYSSSQGSLSPLNVPKGLHSPSSFRRDPSTLDFRTSLMRPMSYASEIGFDPDPETGGGPTPESYEDGPEGDDWMYDKDEGDKKEVWQEQSTSYGGGRGFVVLRAANLFCLLFVVLALIVLFIGYPILDKTVLHQGLGGGKYHKDPVARPAGTCTGTDAAPGAAETQTGEGGLFGRRHY